MKGFIGDQDMPALDPDALPHLFVGLGIDLRIDDRLPRHQVWVTSERSLDVLAAKAALGVVDPFKTVVITSLP